jgi:hypothetical protein
MKNRIIKITPFFIIIASVALWFSYSKAQSDSFSPYRDFEKKALSINKPSFVKHYGAEEALIREKLKLELSQKERSILAGLHWILGLVDDDEAFAFLFPDFMLFIDKMSHCEDRIHQKEVVDAIIKKSFTRASSQLATFFSDKNDADMARWRYIGLFPILLKYPEFQEKYFNFYQERWPLIIKPFEVKDTSFSNALATNKYKAIFDYLIWPSFLHYYLADIKKAPVHTPPNHFPEYVEALKKFHYKNHPLKDPAFRDLGYLATHVVLALTNYGLLAAPDDENIKKVKKYLKSTFEKTKKLGDFDLFAEYIFCIKILEPKNNKIPQWEKFLYDLQRPDGSWGSERDFVTNPYTAIHPAGAALMALNQQ